ncbi:hypothetical protein JEM67_09830 [Serratia sp. PAMC26656]|uniref:hypothetical protein n=1 Tax=Serratia sp. PAMC26656 TaxID=2775909 RepID=UPI0018F5CCB5|nr:hypothetical protein [Serratia sp. PAMC26656]MBJ7889560.1 hypothetical protein [Serratia sp. PAMC26656]
MIKRFNPDFSLSISHELAYMRETPEGGYVAHGDYATLFSELELVKADRDAQQKRADALAVENATLRVAVDGFNEELYGKGFEVLGWHLNGATEPLDNWFGDNDWNPETPDTDAALAAIEARGVEKFVTKVAERLRTAGGEDGYSLVHFGEYADHLEAKGEEFATELREGK